MKILLVLLCLVPLHAFSESYEDDEVPQESFTTEEALPENSEQDLERQEEVLHPFGETNDWSLGSEDLPAEDYE